MIKAARYWGAILFFILFTGRLWSQSSWDEQARQFVNSAAKNQYKYTIQEVYGAIEESNKLVSAYCKTCSPEQLSALYLARANLRIHRLEYKIDSADGDYKAPPKTISEIKTDFLKAQTFCQSCKCGMFDNIVDFYSNYGTQQQMDSLQKEARAMGKPTDHTYIGFDLNFIPQKSVTSAAIGIVNAWTVRQPKKWRDANGKKFRKCKYDYPMATGYCFVGYELSFDNSRYSAFKLDPVWFNYILSVHPAQLLYANNLDGKTLIYRPELGFSFSVFAVNYALNIPFQGSFGYLAQHNVSIRFTIPAIRLN